jgi:CHAT domain-containing protein
MDPERPEEDPVVGFLVRRYVRGAPAGPCPEEDLLAAMAGGSLLAEERERLVEHLAACERCGGVVAALSKGKAPAGLRDPARRGVLRIPIPSWAGRRGEAGAPLRSIEIGLPVAAAALLLGVAGVFFGSRLLTRGPGVDGRPPLETARIPLDPAGGPAPSRPAPETDGILLASAADLARSRPALFRDFAPLSREERLAPPPTIRGGASGLIYPAGRILETRPSLRWEETRDGTEREVVVRASSGAAILRTSAKGSPLEYPAGAPDLDAGGQYSWTVSGLGDQVFAVATSEERAEFESAVSAIGSQAPADVRELLLSHFALRRGYLGEAERSARRFLSASDIPREGPDLSRRVGPDPSVPKSSSSDPVGVETLRHVLRLLGSSEADRLERGGPARADRPAGDASRPSLPRQVPIPATGPAPRRSLRVGDVVTDRLEPSDPVLPGHGPGAVYAFDPESAGTFTVSMESIDFDAFLRIETEAGERVAEDDNGGVESNARAVVQVEQGRRYRINAASAKEGGGEFTLSVASGDLPRPSGGDLLDAAIAFRHTAADRALARGEGRRAFVHRLEEGNRLRSRSRIREAKVAYESALALARELRDRAGEERAVGGLGFVHWSLGEYPRARELYESNLELSREIDDRAAEGRALGGLGRVDVSLGEYAAGREHHEESLALAREARDRAGEAEALVNLGTAHYSLGDVSTAGGNYEEALTLAREIGDRPVEARAIRGIGNVHFRRGDLPKAREHYEKMLDLSRELGDRSAEAKAYGNLGVVAYAVGDYAKAREAHEKNLAGVQALGDRAGEAAALANLGDVDVALADYPKAREHIGRRLAIVREIGDRAGEARALSGLGTVERSLGEHGKAREHYEEALALARQVGDRQGEATTIGSLGNLYRSLGDFPKARQEYERHLSLAREIGDRAGEVLALGSLGVVEYFLGDYPKALEIEGEHLVLARELGDRAGEARALAGLGNVALELGDPSKALEWYEGWLALVRQIGDRAGESMALGNLGNVYGSLGDYPRARENHLGHLALARELGDRAGEVRALGNLGSDELALGHPPEALERCEESLALARELGDREAEAKALATLGDVHFALRDNPKARESARGALDLFRQIGSEGDALFPLETLGRVAVAERDGSAALAALAQSTSLLDRPSLRGLEPGRSTGLRARFAGLGRISQDLAALRVEEARSDPEERTRALADGFGEAGRWKGKALLEGIAEHRAGGRSAQALAIRREWREALARRDGILQRLAESIRAGSEPKAIEDLRGEARAEEGKAQDLARRLRENSPRDATVDLPVGARPDQVRGVLGKGSALVDYAEGERRLYAYVLAEKGLAFVDLGERKALEVAAGEYAFSVASLQIGASVQGITEKGQALFESLLAPVLKEAGEGIQRLVVVPTPALAAVPFEALVTGRKREGEPSSFADLGFVLDRYEVCYAPSSPVLVELASLGPRRGEDKILVLSDPVYPTEPVEAPGDPESRPSSLVAWGGRRAAPEPGKLERLMKTREEAIGVVQMLVGPEEEGVAAALTRLSDRRSASLSGRFFDLYLGAEASRQRLAGDLRRYSVLHFAAHGNVEREFPQRTGIVLTAAGEEEGLYTIGDVLDGLDVDAKFVVLSACDTARGEVKQGEGVESMARAFMYAGARGVVASLWQVDDVAAAETMGEFYRGALKRGLPPSQALWEAKRSMRGSKRVRGVAGLTGGPRASVDAGHPYFWAPFIYIGLPH